MQHAGSGMRSGRTRDGLCYERVGHGPFLVLAHELGGSMRSFDALTRLLQDDFTVVRYDLRGHGGSVRTTEGYDLESQIGDLQGVLAETGKPERLWILSIAAASPMAVTLAHRSPAVAGLVMCSAAIAMDDRRGANLCARADEAERDGMAAIADSTLDRSYPPEIRQDAASFAHYRAMLLENTPAYYAQANRALAASRTADTARELRCPVLCLAGRYDRVRPPAIIQELAASIAGGEYRMLEGAHLLAYQNPGAVADAARDFIARHDGLRQE